jgi:hypothetical protein
MLIDERLQVLRLTMENAVADGVPARTSPGWGCPCAHIGGFVTAHAAMPSRRVNDEGIRPKIDFLTGV